MTRVVAFCALTMPSSAWCQVASGTVPLRVLRDSTFSADTADFTPAQFVTLRDAIERALALSPISQRAYAVSRLARGAERVAFGEYLPYVGATTTLGHNGAPSLPIQALNSVIGPVGIGGGNAGASRGSGGADTGSTRTSVSQSNTASTFIAPPTAALRNLSGAQFTSLALPDSSSSGSATQPWLTPALTLTAGYDVFTGGRRHADVARARAESDAADAIAVRQRFVVVDSVQMAFFQVFRAQELDSLAREQAARAVEDAREANRRHEIGTATTDEVLQFETDLFAARTTLLQAEIDRRSGAYALGRLIGIDGGVIPRDNSAGAVRPLALADSEIVHLAVTSNPVLVAARDSARAADAALEATRTEYLPTLRLGTSYTFTRSMPASAASAIKPGWSIGISTTYPIFNGFVREYDVQRSSEAARLARVTARDAEHKALADVQKLLGDASLSIRQVALAQQSVTSARENYRVQYNRYHLVLATVLELRSAEQALTTASQQLVNARFNYILARGALETLVGREL